MTNHGCSVCWETIAISEINANKAYMVSVLPHNTWTDKGVICSCGALNPFDGPAVYNGTTSAAIQRDKSVKESLKNGK